MTRRLSIYAPIIVLLCAAMQFPACAMTEATVSGVVRDAKGAPQIGTLVQLVKPDLSVIAQTFTDDHGHYTLPSILPGVYGIKATAALFLPTLRENLRIAPSSRLIVNLTLSTLYEAFRWLPAQPRQVDEPQDDWTWTLRLSANRPLLRLLGDGPLVVVQEAEGQNAAQKARVTIRGGESGFADGGVHNGFEMRRTNDDNRQLLLRAELSEADNPALNTSVGYEQQLSPGRTLRNVVAFVDRPEIAGGPDVQGLEAMVLRTAETMELTPGVQAEAGNEFEAVHLGTTTVANHPFASVRVQAGTALVAYHMATTPGVQRGDEIDRPNTLLPSLGENQGRLVLEHGLHQELSLSNSSGNLRWSMTVFQDHETNPVIEGGGNISSADWKSGELLYDSATGTIRATAAGFSSDGVVAELKDTLPGDMWIAFDAATGDTITLDAHPVPVTLQNGLLSLHPSRTEMYSATFGGKLDRAKTQWQASYRWQQPASLTAVDAFNKNLPDPYLSFYLRQPIHYRFILPNGMEALIDVRNLLAQGYRPLVTSDGSVLYFAEAARSIEGGLAFTF